MRPPRRRRAVRDWVQAGLQVLLVIAGGGLVIGESLLWQVFWSVLALAYVIVRWVAPPTNAGILGVSRTARRLRLAFAVLASLVGMTGGLSIVLADDMPDGEASRFIAVPVVVLAWAVLNFGLADLYHAEAVAAARRGEAEPLEFGGDRREPSDYVYFAFTLATTFATSDVTVMTPRLRRLVVTHSVIAFLYNTAILGTAIAVITSR